MRDRTKPTYVEAYPRISSLRCTGADRPTSDKRSKKAKKPRPDFCQFFNESGLCFGDAVVRGQMETVLWLTYDISGPYVTRDDGTVRLSLATVPSGTHRNRKFFVCDGCERRVIILVFDGCWLCRTCHELIHRSQILLPDVQDYEAMNSLQAEIGRGRPHRMRTRTFERKMAELTELERRFAGRWICASEKHRYHVTPQWSLLREFDGEVFSNLSGSKCGVPER